MRYSPFSVEQPNKSVLSKHHTVEKKYVDIFKKMIDINQWFMSIIFKKNDRYKPMVCIYQWYELPAAILVEYNQQK